MFTGKFTRRVHLALAVFLFSGALGVAFGAYILWPSRREAGYEPAQPIEFSHKLHAGELKIDCLYCHSEAERGAHATVPSVATCMNCHQQVQKKDENGELTPATAALVEHWEKKKPIVWNKVHDLADFVYFDHSRHLAADVECQECHGPVETMERVRREFGQKMSWCLNCHNQALPEDPPPYARHWATRAPTNCTTCHR
jgi:hypothetical protein